MSAKKTKRLYDSPECVDYIAPSARETAGAHCAVSTGSDGPFAEADADIARTKAKGRKPVPKEWREYTAHMIRATRSEGHPNVADVGRAGNGGKQQSQP